uniref:N-alpha-acetyltransferase 40 n=1 Tax=Oryza meridionalis TaxID=40149 RepID=A0A0E0CS31_9ORYZ
MATAEKKRPRSSGGGGGGVEKRPSRKQILGRKKAVEELIRKAVAVKDHLAQFPDFHKYQRNGLLVYLESGHGNQLPLPTRKYIQNLLKVNMEGQYGPEWPSEEKVKRREMVAPEARYIFMEPSAQGKGLGKFLMELIELIACKSQMGAVMLTVQKANNLAMAFYKKLRYVISSTSPSRVDPLCLQIGLEKNYKILCKAFESEAKSKLERAGKAAARSFFLLAAPSRRDVDGATPMRYPTAGRSGGGGAVWGGGGSGTPMAGSGAAARPGGPAARCGWGRRRRGRPVAARLPGCGPAAGSGTWQGGGHSGGAPPGSGVPAAGSDSPGWPGSLWLASPATGGRRRRGRCVRRRAAGRRGSGWRRRCLPPDLVDDRRWRLLPDGWLRCGGPDWDAGLHGGGGVVARRPCGGAAGVGRWSCRRIWGRARIQPHSTAITTDDDEGTPCGCLLISLELLPFLTAWSWGAPFARR